MMLEFAHPRGLVIPAAHREFVYRHRQPPGGMQVFLGCYIGNELNTFYWQDRLDGPDRLGWAYTVTLGAGGLVAQLWAPSRREVQVTRSGVLGRRIPQIWPAVADVSLTPALGIDDATLLNARPVSASHGSALDRDSGSAGDGERR
jgi:hypothetical protein